MAFLDRGDKAIAAAMHGLDHPLGPPTVANRPAHRLEALGQRGLADALVRPQALEEFLLGHHAGAMRDEIGEYDEALFGTPCKPNCTRTARSTCRMSRTESLPIRLISRVLLTVVS